MLGIGSSWVVSQSNSCDFRMATYFAESLWVDIVFLLSLAIGCMFLWENHSEVAKQNNVTAAVKSKRCCTGSGWVRKSLGYLPAQFVKQRRKLKPHINMAAHGNKQSEISKRINPAFNQKNIKGPGTLNRKRSRLRPQCQVHWNFKEPGPLIFAPCFRLYG